MFGMMQVHNVKCFTLKLLQQERTFSFRVFHTEALSHRFILLKIYYLQLYVEVWVIMYTVYEKCHSSGTLHECNYCWWSSSIVLSNNTNVLLCLSTCIFTREVKGRDIFHEADLKHQFHKNFSINFKSSRSVHLTLTLFISASSSERYTTYSLYVVLLAVLCTVWEKDIIQIWRRLIVNTVDEVHA